MPLRGTAGTLGILALATPVLAQDRPMVPRPLAVSATIGVTFEDNERVGDEALRRLPVPLVLGIGSPRSTQIEIEPSAGWHTTATGTDASGVSYTRVRVFHFFGAAHRFSVGPDVEIYFKTETQQALGFGYNRVMPGIQAAWRFRDEFRATVRARYEFSGGEDPGVTALSRIVVRSTVYLPQAGRLVSWIRNDVAFDLHGNPNQYNVEGNAGLRVGRLRRLTLFVQPRVYVGTASRVFNRWRLRTGFSWSLGNVILHHAPHESDLRRASFGESSPHGP